MSRIELLLVIVVFAAVVTVLRLIRWHRQKQALGTIACQRCRHGGPPRGLWQPFRGIRPVCAVCDGDDWVTVQ
jgi:hypothetical protein